MLLLLQGQLKSHLFFPRFPFSLLYVSLEGALALEDTT